MRVNQRFLKKKTKKKHLKLDINRMLENAIVSIVAGIIIALFSFWLTKTYGFTVLGG